MGSIFPNNDDTYRRHSSSVQNYSLRESRGGIQTIINGNVVPEQIGNYVQDGEEESANRTVADLQCEHDLQDDPGVTLPLLNRSAVTEGEKHNL